MGGALAAASGAWFPRAAGSSAWRGEVLRALKKNKGVYEAKYVQLATLEQGAPRCRTVVFRGFLEAPSEPGAAAAPTEVLEFITDTRSAKVAQIAANPAAEAAWYLPRTREQFRVRGNLRLVTADAAEAGLGHLLDARRARWAQISDAARSGFAWAPPGEPLVESEGEGAAGEGGEQEAVDPEEPLGSFALLLLEPHSVDHLILKGTPQRRTMHTLDAEGSRWASQRVNP